MNSFEKIVHFLKAGMTVPTNYSWFHLMFIGLVIIATVSLCLLFKNCGDKTVRRISLICWIIIVLLEIYKQTVFSFNYDAATGMVDWSYQWYAFPYQLCSTPIYVLPFIIFLKSGRVRDAFIAYMAFFSMFGGLAVFFYPNDVFINIIGINIQTMTHHGLQIVLGIFFAVHERRRFNFKFYLKSIPVFASLVLIAVVSNEFMYSYFSKNGIEDTFNMFYISRHFDCTLPVLSEIYKIVPYPVFSLIYIIGFAFVAFIIYLVEKLIISLVNNSKTKAIEQQG